MRGKAILHPAPGCWEGPPGTGESSIQAGQLNSGLEAAIPPADMSWQQGAISLLERARTSMVGGWIRAPAPGNVSRAGETAACSRLCETEKKGRAAGGQLPQNSATAFIRL